jgi:lipopolysaccharide transport system permease protein
VGVFLRDLREVIALVLVAMLFLSPIFYSIDRMPEFARALIRLNPVAVPVMQIRDVAYYGEIPDPMVWLQLLVVSAIFARVGYSVFSRCRGAFADVV